MRQKYIALNFLLASLNAADVDLLKPDTTINQIKNFCTLSEEVYNSESIGHRFFLLNQKIVPMLSVEKYPPLFKEYLKLFFSDSYNDFLLHFENSFYYLSYFLWNKLREIALCDIDCINRYVATLIFIKNANAADREAVLPIIRSVAKDVHHEYHFYAVYTLMRYGNDEDREAARRILKFLAKDPNCQYQFDAAQIIINTSGAADREAVLPLIKSVVKDAHHPKQCEAAKILLYFGEVADREAAYQIAGSIIKNAYHPKQHEAAQLIIYRDLRCRGYGEYKEAALSILRSIAENAHHPCQYTAARTLIYDSNDDDKEAALPIIRSIAENAHHQCQYTAAQVLNFQGKGEYKEAALSILRSIAENAHHPCQYTAASTIIYDGNDDDKEAAKRCIKSIAGNAHHPRQYDALEELIYNGNAADHAVARDVINKVFTENHNKKEDMKKKCVRILRESNDPLDQELGLKLKQRYFTVFKPETQERMQYFNLDTINKYMPLPLADLSDNNMDIVDEFNSIMKRIKTDPAQNSDPFYLDTFLIEHAYTFDQIRLRANGFIKTLTGKALDANETGGWQMYDDVKPDMINSIKHIIIALNKQFALNEPDEIRSAVLSLATVLKGILYCPTGQSEGIENAVNSLVRKTNIAAGDAVALIGRNVVASAVQKAFNNAFYYDGGVHGLARARMVLRAHINIPQAIESFKERISRVSDDEIPEFYNKFFDIFNTEFLIKEARRNIQTPSDFDVISDPKQKEAAKLIKMERPISVSSIAQWVYDHPLEGEDKTLIASKCGIDDEFKSISDDGLIEVLKRMEFIF